MSYSRGPNWYCYRDANTDKFILYLVCNFKFSYKEIAMNWQSCINKVHQYFIENNIECSNQELLELSYYMFEFVYELSEELKLKTELAPLDESSFISKRTKMLDAGYDIPEETIFELRKNLEKLKINMGFKYEKTKARTSPLHEKRKAIPERTFQKDRS